MKISNLPKEFLKAIPVMKQLEEAGYEAYFVGGCVRDTLLGKPIHDIDIATSAFPEEVKRVFSKTIDVGIEHGTVLVLFSDEKYEITTFRTESEYQDYRRPERVQFVRSLKEDLKRRDFTINALAMDCQGNVIDLFDGIVDLKNKLIRAVGNPTERFHEDALRMMRGLRFASQLGFQIQLETLEGIRKFHHLLEKISVERITVEFSKLLMGRFRRKGLSCFVETECYIYCPQLRLRGENLLNMASLSEIPFATEIEAWTLLCYYLKLSPDEVPAFLKEWKTSKQFSQDVTICLSALLYREKNQWTPLKLYQYGLNNSVGAEHLLFYLGLPNFTDETKKQYNLLPIHMLSDLSINGQEIQALYNRKGGPWLGKLLELLETAVVENQIKNDKKELIAYLKQHREEESF